VVQAGHLTMAQVKSTSGAGFICHLADGSNAIAALTSLHDMFVPNALENVRPGAIVRAFIARGRPDDKGRLPLSLHQRDGASHAGVPLDNN
jgi:hypothetical protein